MKTPSQHLDKKSEKNLDKNLESTLKNAPSNAKAWWHYGHAWLVFGGPAAVVVASLITVYIAVSHRDPVVDEDYYQKGVNINHTMDANGKPLTAEEMNALAPAVRARNHAATGVTPP